MPFGGFYGNCRELRAPSYLHLHSAIFDDGKYEGDVRHSSAGAASPFAAMLLRRRFRQIADPILADPQLDDAAKIIRLRAAAESLPDEPDQQLLADVHRMMRGLPNTLPREFTDYYAAGGVRIQKRFLREALAEYQPGISPPVSEWWRERLLTVAISTEMQNRVTGH